MGKKKKMHGSSVLAASRLLAKLLRSCCSRIKVTKTLVEKPARRASSVDRFVEPSVLAASHEASILREHWQAAQLTEVELAEVL